MFVPPMFSFLMCAGLHRTSGSQAMVSMRLAAVQHRQRAAQRDFRRTANDAKA